MTDLISDRKPKKGRVERITMDWGEKNMAEDGDHGNIQQFSAMYIFT